MTLPIGLGRVIVVAVALSLTARADLVDDTVSAQMRKHHIPGLSLAVIQGGAIVRAQAYGVIEAGKPANVNVATLFEAGSISKSVAAVGVLRLIDEGTLTLDADVNATLKSWKVPENEFTKEEKVTLRRLLSHSAGLAVHQAGSYRPGESLPTLVQILNGERPANTPPVRVKLVPGSKWRYSGGGYAVVQLLICEVTGQTFPQFMEKAVLAPVSMRASSFSQPATQETLAIAAYGHDFLGEPEPFTSYVYPLMAAAGLWTTPSDLARFAIALQRAYFGKEGAVLTSGIAREMFNIQKNPSGLGVFISGEGHTKRFGHTGQAIGFDSEFLAYVETGQGAVVMINANDHSRTISRIFDAVASAYSWPDYSARVQAPPPAKADVLEDNDPHFTAQVREIFQRAAENGTYDATIFTKEGAAEISAPVEKWMKEIQGWGPLHAIELIGPAPRQPHNYLYRLSFEKYEILVYCERNEAGMISEFDLTYE